MRVYWKHHERQFLARRVARSLLAISDDFLSRPKDEVERAMIGPLRAAIEDLPEDKRRAVRGPSQVPWLYPMVIESAGEAEVAEEAAGPEESRGELLVAVLDDLRRSKIRYGKLRKEIGELAGEVRALSELVMDLAARLEREDRPKCDTPRDSPAIGPPRPVIALAGPRTKDLTHILPKVSQLAEIRHIDYRKTKPAEVSADFLVSQYYCGKNWNHEAQAVFRKRFRLVEGNSSVVRAVKEFANQEG